jgi:hypothetical protein
MTPTACNLEPMELHEQLERYRAIGRLAAWVEQEPGRVVVRFADDPPSALIDRTVEVERDCCPFFDIDYDPAIQRLAISVDQPDRLPSLDAIVRALTESRGTGLAVDSGPQELHTGSGDVSCCSPAALETCCEPQDKQNCCGQAVRGESTLTPPSRCGCDA